MAALGQFALNVIEEINEPVSKLNQFVSGIHENQNETGDIASLVEELIGSALEASADLKKMIINLQSFSDEIQKDENVKKMIARPTRFLIVEDEPEIISLIERRLRRMGHELIETASNGQEAYNVCVKSMNKGKKIDAIISDWNMPKMTGLQLLEKLRENVFYQDVPFMMLTALDQQHYVEKAIDSGVSQYLMKPFRQEELEEKVGKLLLGLSAN